MIRYTIKDYKIIKEIGKGGMATVYLAEHVVLNNNSAIKVLNLEYVRNENIRKRFLAEARNMARMSHPNIIKVTDLIDGDGAVCFVMEYIDGETLKQYLDRKGKLSDDEIKSFYNQMLEAVGYVHEQNLVHRDIKPSNFMIDKQGKVKLLDFGIAKNTDISNVEYTQTGTYQNMGTPMYMSPEQIKSTKDVTLQSDIYSLGVVLWQMITGQKPYDVKTASTFELQTKIVNEKLHLTSTIFDSIIALSTEKELASRFKNCNEVKVKFANLQKSSGGNYKNNSNQDTGWESVGWYSIEPQKSFGFNLPSTFTDQSIYWYATNSEGGKYEGSDSYFCIDAQDAFHFYSNENCNEQAGFYKLDLTGSYTSQNLGQ